MHGTRCVSHQALQHLTPGSFAFHRDMFFDLPLLTDIIALQNTRQQLVDSRLLKENSSRIKHDYKIGDPILKKMVLSLSDKLKPTFTGPHPILQVHTNGTVTIHLRDNLTERINIHSMHQALPHLIHLMETESELYAFSSLYIMCLYIIYLLLPLCYGGYLASLLLYKMRHRAVWTYGVPQDLCALIRMPTWV